VPVGRGDRRDGAPPISGAADRPRDGRRRAHPRRRPAGRGAGGARRRKAGAGSGQRIVWPRFRASAARGGCGAAAVWVGPRRPAVAFERVVALARRRLSLRAGALGAAGRLDRAAARRAAGYSSRPDAWSGAPVGTVLLDKTGTLTEGRPPSHLARRRCGAQLARDLELESSHAVPGVSACRAGQAHARRESRDRRGRGAGRGLAGKARWT